MFLSYFLIGFKVLIIITIIFWAVSFGFIFYWSEVKSTFIFVPLILTFKFFIAGLAVLIVISLLVDLLLPMLS